MKKYTVVYESVVKGIKQKQGNGLWYLKSNLFGSIIINIIVIFIM